MTSAGPILIVDDDDWIRDLIDMSLADEGYAVVGAADGRAALEMASRHHPSLILLDLAMPVMNGWDFMAAYRAGPGPHAPVIIVAAARNVADAARQLGAQAYLQKPFELDDLLRLAARYTGPPA